MRIGVTTWIVLSTIASAPRLTLAQEGASPNVAPESPDAKTVDPKPEGSSEGPKPSTPIDPMAGGGDTPEGTPGAPAAPVEGRPKSAPHGSGQGVDLSKELKRPIYKKMSLSIGSAHGGRQVRAKKLRGSPVLHILKKDTDKIFGHPSLVLMLQRSAKQVAKSFSGSKLVVGDLSAEDGGPLEGHHSHQSGRDADVLFYARDAKGKQILPKKFVQYDANGKATDGSGLVFDDERNWALVESWAGDKRAGLKYIFVARWLRQRLLSYALKHAKHRDHVPEAAALFLQPEGAEPHDDHFHVRIKCPTGQEKICIE